MNNSKRYYIIKVTKDSIEYKRYKCIEGWSRTPENCWKFSKAGAIKIVNEYNENCHYADQPYPKKLHYNFLEAK